MKAWSAGIKSLMTRTPTANPSVGTSPVSDPRQQAIELRAEAFKLMEQIKKIESVPPRGIEDNIQRNRELFRLRREVGRLSRLAANLDAMRLKQYGAMR